MTAAQFPWRPLGQLLVDRGLLTQASLDRALAEQRRTGRLLGQVLVWGGYVSARALAIALAEQQGVGLRGDPGTPGDEPRRESRGDGPWRPLGRVLVDMGFVTRVELEHALAEKRRHPDRRLGEILVRDGYVTGPELALALAEQHGVGLGSEAELGDGLETVLEPPAPGEPSYRVRTAVLGPVYRPGSVIFSSASFLEAADFACEYVQRERPPALEIEKLGGVVPETVWTYSEARAAASR